jgi:hypothetical protein
VLQVAAAPAPQQGWPDAPHATQLPPVQLNPVVQRTVVPAPPQQAWSAPPQSVWQMPTPPPTHTPSVHAGLEVVQQGSPAPPHALGFWQSPGPTLHARPVLQALLSQQVSPSAPQAMQVPVAPKVGTSQMRLAVLQV